jgi:hypothetical protein
MTSIFTCELHCERNYRNLFQFVPHILGLIWVRSTNDHQVCVQSGYRTLIISSKLFYTRIQRARAFQVRAYMCKERDLNNFETNLLSW